ncbi:MAG: GNAT family N-acetyltransferase [Clostridia bacterium]|nr:GNAT family N-acetyltransferase [Clostridia bacterium]
MFSLNICNDTVFFEDIKIEHLPLILKWYNKVDDFRFATGIDNPISLDVLTRKYAEVAICSNEFFVGVYLCKEKKMIGILKGRFEYENKQSAWISSIVIDPQHQKKGYGSAAVSLLISFLKEKSNIRNVYLAVIEENIQGRSFWNKHHFIELRRIENHLKLQNRQQNVLIMQKSI